jgi:sarcosine oxidase, subunit beta
MPKIKRSILIPDSQDFPQKADVVVIGGGIVGVATAFWLSNAGLDVILLEMRDGLSTLTTPNSVECFRAQFNEPEMVALAVESIQVFENFADVIGIPGYDISLHQHGYLFVTDDESCEIELMAAVEQHHQLGVTDSEFLSGIELKKRYPFLSEKAIAATFRQNDGWLSSHEATQGFASGSQAKFFLKTKAIGIKQDANEISGVETRRGFIHTRNVVNAAGPFAGEVGKMVGLDLPLEPVRRQKAFIAPKPEIPQDAPMTIDLIRDVYWRPDVGGAYIGWVDPDEPVSQPSEDLPVDRFFAAQTLEQLAILFPFWGQVAENLKATEVYTSAGQYVYTPDDKPLIGQVSEIKGFYLNCGYWAGVMLSPAAGKRIADLITGKLKPEENPLRPTRYQEGISLSGDSFLSGRH